MRIVLTVIALLVISALTAALIGPYYVDWSKQRAVVEAQLSHILRERVAVKGAIDVKLLPSPYVTLNQVEISDPKTGGILFSCNEMELALGLTSLARGQFRFTQATFDRPILDLASGPDGGIVLPKLNLATNSESIAFDKVIVHDGRLQVMRADGVAESSLDGIDLDAEADSLLGPYKGSARATGPGGARTRVQFRDRRHRRR